MDEARSMCDVRQQVGEDGAVGAWWHGRRVPVAVDHGVFLDGARLGRHHETADALSGGGAYRPVVVDGVLGRGC